MKHFFLSFTVNQSFDFPSNRGVFEKGHSGVIKMLKQKIASQ